MCSGNVSHSYECMPHHLQSSFACNLSVGVGPARLVESSCLLRAATQHPGSSSPVSLLRCSPAGVIWMQTASLSSSSLGCLAMSTTVVSSHLMARWSFHACSATADFSKVPFQQASWCSLSLVSMQPSPGLTNVALATTAGDLVHHLGLLLHW